MKIIYIHVTKQRSGDFTAPLIRKRYAIYSSVQPQENTRVNRRNITGDTRTSRETVQETWSSITTGRTCNVAFRWRQKLSGSFRAPYGVVNYHANYMPRSTDNSGYLTKLRHTIPVTHLRTSLDRDIKSDQSWPSLMTDYEYTKLKCKNIWNNCRIWFWHFKDMTWLIKNDNNYLILAISMLSWSNPLKIHFVHKSNRPNP